MVLLAMLLLCSADGMQAQAPEAPPLTAGQIMQEVARNQDKAQEERSQYVYEQHIRVASRHTNGKLAREETTDLLTVPGPKGVEQKQQSIQGRYQKKGRLLAFQGEPVPDADGLDYDLVHDFRHDLLEDKASKDGLANDLFPLTTSGQKDLQFRLAGEQTVSGRAAYRIEFEPKQKGDYGWAGEALIDKEELQPVSVYTRFSRKLPLFVRTVLGTDVPGLGFSTRYRRIEKNVWFPVSFGTEFRLRAVFFINRSISVSMESKNFRRAQADSTIRYAQ